MDQNIYSKDRSNIDVPKLVFSNFKKPHQDNFLDKRHVENISSKNVSCPILNFYPQLVSPKFKADEVDMENKQLFANSYHQKRKFEEIEKDQNECQNNFSSKFSKTSDSNYLKEENYWEQYTSLKLYFLKSYSSLLPSMHHKDNLSPGSLSLSSLTSAVSPPKHIDQGEANAFHIEQIFTNAAGKSINISNTEILAAQKLVQSAFQDETRQKIDSDIDCIPVRNKELINVPVLKNSCITLSPPKHTDQGKANAFHIEEIFTNVAGKSTNISYTEMLAAQKSVQSAFQDEIHQKTDNDIDCVSSVMSTPPKHTDQDKANAFHIEEVFTTVAGKSANISYTEMLGAQELVQSTFQEETYPKIGRVTDCISIRNKQLINEPVLKSSSVTSCPTRNHIDVEITTGDTNFKSVKNNHEFVFNYDADDLSFSTAAGKTVDISDAAMKAAHKLLSGAFESEDKILPSTSVTYNTCRKNSALKDIGCPPKKSLSEDDDNIDNTLLEKFFQGDAFFDEKEPQDSAESSKSKDFDNVLESKTNNDPTTRKIRKSLGGRRSMRFYSHK